MFCKKCGKEFNGNGIYCTSCANTYQQKEKQSIGENFTENTYKIVLAVLSIVILFLPWVKVSETSVNFFKANTIMDTAKKINNGILEMKGEDLKDIAEELDLHVDKVKVIFNNILNSDNENLLLLQGSKLILFIVFAVILINLAYIAILILGKEKPWMLVSLILSNIIFSILIIMLGAFSPTAIVGLSFGPVAMFAVQGIFGELAVIKE